MAQASRSSAIKRAAEAVFCSLLVCSCAPLPFHTTFLEPEGPVAAAQRNHLLDVFLLLLVVVLPVFVLTPIVAWRYRYKNRAGRYAPKWAVSRPLEIAIWGVPVCVVIVLSVWLWRATDRLDPYVPLRSSAQPLRIEVIGYDWKWLFVYPDQKIASIGEMAIPTNRPVELTLTSDTVMQSFLISALGSQIYAMAGMTTHLNLAADKPGRFRGENTQYNGRGFAQQRFDAVAMSASAFKAWVDHARSHGLSVTPAIYRRIAARNTRKALEAALHLPAHRKHALYFKNVPPHLLAAVIRSFHGGPPVLPMKAAVSGHAGPSRQDVKP